MIDEVPQLSTVKNLTAFKLYNIDSLVASINLNKIISFSFGHQIESEMDKLMIN